MKVSATFLTAALISTVAAKSCHQGGVYCGSSLLNQGNYRDHIIRVLTQNHQPTDEDHITKSKFDCQGGGEIVFREYCKNGCGGTGSTDPDYCL